MQQNRISRDALARDKVYHNDEMRAFPAEEAPGVSVFCKGEDGQVLHTCSSYARGAEMLLGAYCFLDLVPERRDEAEPPWSMAWVRHHDRYGN